MPLVEEQVTVGDVRLACIRQASADAPDSARKTLLFLHGNSSCKEAFAAQFEAFAATDWDLIAFDFPGHGQSDRASDPMQAYTIPGYAETLRAFVDALGLTSHGLVLVGWSLGGHVALEAAAQGLDVAGIVISGAPPIAPGDPKLLTVFQPTQGMAVSMSEDADEAALEAYGREVFGALETVPPVLIDAVFKADPRARGRIAAHWGSGESGHDHAAFVATSSVPVAVIQGADETFIDNAYFSTVAWRNLWRGAAFFIDGAQHAPMVERPDAFNAALASFLIEMIDVR